MADVKLDIAFWNYDRTRALSDGKVRIPGVEFIQRSSPNTAKDSLELVLDLTNNEHYSLY